MLHFQKLDLFVAMLTKLIETPWSSTASVTPTMSFPFTSAGHDHGGDHVHG